MNRLLIILFLFWSQLVFAANPNSFPITNSVLSSGRWVKAKSNQSGIHKVTFSALKSMGFLTPQRVKFFGFPSEKLSQKNSDPSAEDLIQFRVWQTKDSQQNDCFLLYVPGNVVWKYDPVSNLYKHCINPFSEGISYLYLSEEMITDKPVSSAPVVTGNTTTIVTDFDDFAFLENEKFNLLETGSRWFSSLLTPNSTFQQTFKFPYHITNEPFTITVTAAGRCENFSSLRLTANNSMFGTMSFVPYSNFTEADYADMKESILAIVTNAEDLNLSLTYDASVNGKCWLDYIRVQTRCNLNMRGNQMTFCDNRSVMTGNISEFRLGLVNSELKVWDVSSPLDPFVIQTTAALNTLSFKAATDSLRRFIAFNPSADFPGIEKVGEVENQNLHKLSTPEMVIITFGDFKSQAERLATFHRQKSGLEVEVLEVSKIFNEFSGGITDVTAIRNFVRLLYHKSLNNNISNLKYLLLFGKGTYDNLHPVTTENPCYIPTWQSESSINPASSYVTDDYFGLLGVDEGGQIGKVDIGIGRIPCTNISEAKDFVDKTLHYDTPSTLGDWRNVICFIGDDEDNNIHVSDSEQLANFVNNNYPAFYTDKIYLDAYKEESTPEKRYPGANKAINNRVKEGALIINYIGHANDEGLAHEKILTISDIDNWSNTDKLPVFVTATCEFSRWDLKNKQSAGEHVLFNKTGGGIALFSTTRLVRYE
jgi:hypothetical protein